MSIFLFGKKMQARACHTFIMDINTYMSLHLLIGLGLVQLAALCFSSELPYYPIEMSRIAASGALPLTLFRLVVLSLGIGLHMNSHLVPYTVWVSLIVIAVFDDVIFPFLHMVGVSMLGMSALWLVYQNKPLYSYNFIIVGLAACVFFLRIVAKAAAVYSLEYIHNIQEIPGEAMAIMYTGYASRDTIMVFRICGFLQWVVFAILLQIKLV